MDAGYDKKTFKCKFDYCVGKAANLSDPSLQAKAQDYKRRLSNEMRAISGQDIGRIADASGYYVSRKYDGEFAMLAFDGEQIVAELQPPADSTQARPLTISEVLIDDGHRHAARPISGREVAAGPNGLSGRREVPG